jgi:hypothetical protein
MCFAADGGVWPVPRRGLEQARQPWADYQSAKVPVAGSIGWIDV